ncbi:MAG: type II toxin-antitoxin system RelE/ParE family toxin, partial [Hyphomicrobiales bacterium]|nr:type II toxin-antitoxin system RelE/ParE family toxin [Hyphomicrobiales bacterium]
MLTYDAQNDVADICRYIAQRDSTEAANRVLDALEQCWVGLTNMPERG